ncbi:hypothetical protein ACJRO7_021379 [Eucalyptus globulus]|uniref:Uncharacterized protein n=1 Tax=Eucalyptus globulus TaxID=34317 RepID=A0ABD3KJM4_EUCGL
MRYVFGMESDHVWLSYKLLKLEQRLQNAWSHFQVHLRAEKGSIKKCGFRLICEQKEDDLRVVFPAPSVDRNKVQFFGEDLEEDNSIDTEEEDTPIETDVEESSSPLTKKMRWS